MKHPEEPQTTEPAWARQVYQAKLRGATVVHRYPVRVKAGEMEGLGKMLSCRKQTTSQVGTSIGAGESRPALGETHG